jgi:copper chaperone
MLSTNTFSPARTLRIAALLVGLAFFTAAGAQAQTGEQPASEREEASTDATVHVKGMACQMCARSMKGALGNLEAVESADVQLDEQQVLLTFKRDRKATEEALREAVEGAGYTFQKVVFAEAGPGRTDATDRSGER